MKLYGLIGYPLSHSFSKKYFTQKFEREKLSDCNYELFPIPSIKDLPSILNSNPELKGLNVTIPYKEQVLKYLAETTASVQEIGAANTIKIEGDKLVGHNTDIIGFERSFIKKLKPFHNKALILGTGGSAKAVQYVLKKLSIDFLSVTRKEQPIPGSISYSMINGTMLNEYPVIINCTPAGMYPNDHQYPLIPYQLISEKHYLFDLVYKPEKTMFLQQGVAKGAAVQNGYEMLITQAEESWKIWNS